MRYGGIAYVYFSYRWGLFAHSLGIVQWNSTRRDHPGNPGGVSGSGPVTICIQNAMDLGFIDQIFLNSDCMEFLNDTLRTQLYKLTRTQNYYARFFSISSEYNEDTREYLKSYHLITMNNSEETIIQINDKKNQRKLDITIGNGQKPEEH